MHAPFLMPFTELRTLVAQARASTEPWFTTSATPEALWDIYLANFPDAGRQEHHCHACRTFIQRYGRLATVNADGSLTPVFWHNVENHPSSRMLWSTVSQARVNGVFYTQIPVIGTPETRRPEPSYWTHLYTDVPRQCQVQGARQSALQKMAEKREDFRILVDALTEYDVDVIQQAVRLLRSDTLYRGEHVLGVGEWLLQRKEQWQQTMHGAHCTNLLWKAVATAPAGFCHVKSSMIGTLLDDLKAGLSFDDASRKFAARMHPLQYQRPQAAPSTGNIEQAEKLVEKLGIQASLKRRYASLADVQVFLWRPQQAEEKATRGIFGHLGARK
jgi:hypothetical protein